MVYKFFFTFIVCFFVTTKGITQVVTFSPTYPIMQDSVEIIFDAAAGNGALAGVNTVYMHTGLISQNSLSNSDWKHRINPWPTGDPDLVINDTLVMMQNIGGDLHRIKIKPSTYYGYNSQIDYNAIVFVFRNQDGSLAGKNTDNSDIFIPVFKNTPFDALFFEPLTNAYRVNLNDTIEVEILANTNSHIKFYHDGQLIIQDTSNTELTSSVVVTNPGIHWLKLEANNGSSTIIDSVYYIVDDITVVQNPPFASMNGINYVNDSTVLLQLYAPNKSFVNLIGDFNDWKIDPSYRLKKTTDGTAFWIELTGLIPGQEYRFQYVVEQDVVIADPWADKYLDEFNDVNIFFFTYPGLISYPTGKTHGMVSVFETAQTAFSWQNTSFVRPVNQDLVIYELLIRDFVLRHDYTTLIDTLDYLQNLGINAIELMPINEFDDNKSWGYSPAFYFAPDKFYGPKADLKRFIDECHTRGIAVVLDVVFNHAFSQNTMARLYMDKNSGKPTNDNPWFNSYIPHPFGFYSDFDHSTVETQYFVDRCLHYWLTEYKVDGFRFDLSKGFTQIYSYPSNLGVWSNYDNDRVYWLKRIFNQVRSFDSDCYLILEHFADNAEELELSNHGFMLWGNANSEYKQAAIGYSSGSDFSWAVSSKHRGWPYQHLVGYMESHDEERIMYECAEYGNFNIDNVGDTIYNIREVPTALKRIEACAAFFYTVPGPKLLWQFGEIGYDFSIEFNGRTKEKPLRWNYLQDTNRLHLYKTFAALIQLKTENIAFRSSNYDMDVGADGKRLWVTDPSMNVTVIGNFGVDSLNSMMPAFQNTGFWFDYLSGDTIDVTDVNSPIPLGPGDFHIYTNVKLNTPDLTVDIQNKVLDRENSIISYASPIPFTKEVNIFCTLPVDDELNIFIYDINGTLIKTLVSEFQKAGEYNVQWDGNTGNGMAPSGVYFYKVVQGDNTSVNTILKIN